jgi:hypothetical protein
LPQTLSIAACAPTSNRVALLSSGAEVGDVGVELLAGKNAWANAKDRIAVQIDRRNLYYSLVGNVVGEVGKPATHEFLDESVSSDLDESTLYRLGFPDVGNQGFSGIGRSPRRTSRRACS